MANKNNYEGLFNASYEALIEAGCPPQVADAVSDIVASGDKRTSEQQDLVNSAIIYLNPNNKPPL